MKKKNTRARRPLRPIVLVFGEDHNDTSAICVLARALNPKFSTELSIEPRKEPASLTRGAGVGAIKTWLQKVSDVAAAENQLRSVAAILVHQDSDGPDTYRKVAQNLNNNLKVILEGTPAKAVVPIQMTEGWWLMFPDAVRATKPAVWRDAKFPKGDTASISNPKQALIGLTKRVSKKHAYAESDSLAIAESIVRLGIKPSNVNSSWGDFESLVKAL